MKYVVMILVSLRLTLPAMLLAAGPGAPPETAKPADFPSQLPVLETPRQWGDTFLPKSNTPAQVVQVVPLAGLKNDERIALGCLQGLLAREQPRLWLVRSPEDSFWMDWHRAKGHIDRFEMLSDWTALFTKFRGVAKGAVISDDQLFRGDLLALNVAACDDLIVTSAQLAERLGLPVKLDLRGRFQSYAEGLDWLRSNYKNKLNPHSVTFVIPDSSHLARLITAMNGARSCSGSPGQRRKCCVAWTARRNANLWQGHFPRCRSTACALAFQETAKAWAWANHREWNS